MVEKRVIDDLIILGKAVPELTKNRRATVCTAGYSPELGFVRIYPTNVFSPLKRWNIVSVPVERDSQDTRDESWKIQGSRSEWERLHKKMDVVGQLRRKEDRLKLVRDLIDGCVFDINDVHRSLGIIKPVIKKCYFEEETNYDPTVQETLYGGFTPTTKRQYPVKPKIVYRCSDCRTKTEHNQQVLEWGLYEWMRKNPDNIEQVWDNVGVQSDDWDCNFLVGNQARERTSFMIISILRFKI